MTKSGKTESKTAFNSLHQITYHLKALRAEIIFIPLINVGDRLPHIAFIYHLLQLQSTPRLDS